MTLFDYLSDVPALQNFLYSAQKWHAGQPAPTRCGLGDVGIQQDLLTVLQALWRYVGVDEHNSAFPTAEKINSRPAYEIMMALFYFLIKTHVGPTHFWSLFYATSYAGGMLDWRLHLDVNYWPQQPDDATQIEVEVCIRSIGGRLPSGSGQRFYCPIDSGPHHGQNVLPVAANTAVSYRARFCDANGAPVSMWAYSNEEFPWDIAVPPNIPADYPGLFP